MAKSLVTGNINLCGRAHYFLLRNLLVMLIGKNIFFFVIYW